MRPSIDRLDERDLLQPAQACAAVGGCTLEHMFAPGRGTMRASYARRLFYAHLYREEGWGAGAIARFVGRDRAGVYAGLHKAGVALARAGRSSP
jgi:hypothetical protein